MFVANSDSFDSLLCHDEGDAVGLVGALQGRCPLSCAAVEHGQGGEGRGHALSGARHAAQLVCVVHYGVVVIQLQSVSGREKEGRRGGGEKEQKSGLGEKGGEERKTDKWSIVKKRGSELLD